MSSIDDILDIFSKQKKPSKKPNLYSKFIDDDFLYLTNDKNNKDYLFEPIIKDYLIFNKFNKIENIITKDLYLTKSYKDLDKIINYNIINIIPKKFSKISTSPQGFTGYLEDNAMITADNIAEYVFPIVEYIHATQPDAIVACDRGARLIGLATFMLYKELYGKLPTTDGTVRFRRISKSNNESKTQKHLAPLAKELLAVRKNPTVLVLDDWVVSGDTKRIATDAFENLSNGRIDVKFGVLQGGNADVSGNDSKSYGFAGTVDWHDDAKLIGVNYNGMTAQIVSTQEHLEYRRRMRTSVDNFVFKLSQMK